MEDQRISYCGKHASRNGRQAGMALSLVRQGGSVEYIVGYVANEKLGVIVVVFSVCVNEKYEG